MRKLGWRRISRAAGAANGEFRSPALSFIGRFVVVARRRRAGLALGLSVLLVFLDYGLENVFGVNGCDIRLGEGPDTPTGVRYRSILLEGCPRPCEAIIHLGPIGLLVHHSQDILRQSEVLDDPLINLVDGARAA